MGVNMVVKAYRENKKIIVVVLINVIFILTGALFFFFDHGLFMGETEQRVKVGACYADMSNSYFKILNDEISSAVEEQGDILIARDSLSSQEKQNEQIHLMLEEGVKALIISPVDWVLIKPALIEAKRAGTPVIIVDSPVYDDELVDSTITTDNYDVGVQLANYLMSQRRAAKILLIGQAHSRSSKERVNGFKDTLSQNHLYQIVQEESVDGSVETAMSQMENAIVQGVTFDCVFTVNDNCARGAIAACEKAGRADQIDFLSTDGSPVGKKFIKDQKMMATAAQFPTEMGRKAVETMYHAIQNEDFEKKILVPVKLITQYTINSYDMDKWQ